MLKRILAKALVVVAMCNPGALGRIVVKGMNVAVWLTRRAFLFALKREVQLILPYF
ncbi:hypothetical protein [Legionella spiritensis]|uniref:hypothetical protein n=1 Tax=Legionella spiritensis TaxID=452 RepID=UPI0012E3E593|nr:hypothetical protein [Legionella spiritensis]